MRLGLCCERSLAGRGTLSPLATEKVGRSPLKTLNDRSRILNRIAACY